LEYCCDPEDVISLAAAPVKVDNYHNLVLNLSEILTNIGGTGLNIIEKETINQDQISSTENSPKMELQRETVNQSLVDAIKIVSSDNRVEINTRKNRTNVR
jgi:hypothetical protein